MAYDTIYDVIVCGAGTSGVAAAIGAARTGAKTLLVERTGTMGGQMSLSGPPGFAYARLFNPQGKRDIGGIVEETYQRLFRTGHALPHLRYPVREKAGYSFSYVDPEWWTMLMFEMMDEEGVELLLDTLVVGVTKDGGAVTGITVENANGRNEIRGKIVIDCTGEGYVAAQAGCQMDCVSREDIQPHTLAFTVDGVDWDTLLTYIREHPEQFSYRQLIFPYLQNNVLPNVYDERDQDPDGNWTSVDRTAEYDKLLMKYIEDRTLYEHALIDMDYNDYILSVFAGAPASSSQAAQDRVQEEIQRLAEKINSLQAVYYETNDEYNEYLGAQNIVMLSSVRVTERFPILIFTVLVVIIFGALGCAGAAVLGRIEDFIEYYAFTNKVDGLPNRAKCDQFIAAREGRPIPESFACVVFPPSGSLFVGNNGAGQYLVFAEALDKGQVSAALSQMGVMLEEKSGNGGGQIELRHGFACAGEEKCRYIRELLSIAMKRVGNARPERAGEPVPW